MHRRVLIAAAAATTLAGCGDMQIKERVSHLDPAVTAYVGAVRWGHFETAAAYARPRTAAPRPLVAATLENLKVTGYSVRINRVDETGTEADVSITFTYYYEDRGTIRTVSQQASWYFDEGRNGWLMDDSLPVFVR